MGNNPSVQVPSSPDRNPDRQPSYSESAAQVPLKPLNYLKEERPDYRKWADGKPDFFTHTFAVNITVPRDAKYIDVPKGKGGVGLVLLKDNYRFIVKAMIRGGPAHKSGRIIKGDQLVEVAGRPFNKERLAFSSEEPLNLLGGAAGSTVVLVFVGVDGQAKTVALVRDAGCYPDELGFTTTADMRLPVKSKAFDITRHEGIPRYLSPPKGQVRSKSPHYVPAPIPFKSQAPPSPRGTSSFPNLVGDTLLVTHKEIPRYVSPPKREVHTRQGSVVVTGVSKGVLRDHSPGALNQPRSLPAVPEPQEQEQHVQHDVRSSAPAHEAKMRSVSFDNDTHHADGQGARPTVVTPLRIWSNMDSGHQFLGRESIFVNNSPRDHDNKTITRRAPPIIAPFPNEYPDSGFVWEEPGYKGGNAPTQGTEANIDSRVQGMIRESKTLIRGPLHNSTIPVELKEGDTYVSLKDQGIYLQDVRNIPTQFVEIGPSTWDSVGSPMPDVLHENASVHSPYTRDTVVLKEGGTCIPLKDESGKRSMPGLVARETESLPKGDPNSIYYERARQSDLDDVDGWPALSETRDMSELYTDSRSRPNEGSEDIVRITSNEGSEDIVLRAVT